MTKRLVETLTSQQITNIISGNSNELFDNIFSNEDDFYNLRGEMCLGYYFTRSGEKIITPMFSKLLELNPNNTLEILGKHIRSRYIDNWNRIYNDLITTQYNPLNEMEYEEKKQGTNSDTTTYNTLNENETKSKFKTTTSTNEDNGNGVFGFNSDNPVKSDLYEGESREIVIGNADDNVDVSKNKRTGTDSKTFGINETTTRKGRNDNASTLIDKELKLRQKYYFFDMVYKDIDKILVLQIY